MPGASTSTLNTVAQVKAFKPLYTETHSISISVLFKLDSRIRDTSSIHTLTLWHDTAEDLATVQVHCDETYIQGSKAII